MTTAERIRAALVDKPQGFRGPKREHLHVEVSAADVLELCKAARDQASKVVLALVKGCTRGDPERMVVTQADDAYHLLEQAG